MTAHSGEKGVCFEAQRGMVRRRCMALDERTGRGSELGVRAVRRGANGRLQDKVVSRGNGSVD